MLVATFALSTLSVEQHKQRGFVARLQQRLSASRNAPQQADPVAIASQLEQLMSLDEGRHQPRLAALLMPAVRKATREADALLADLDALSHAGSEMLGTLRQGLRGAWQRDAVLLRGLYRTIELYCNNLLERLAKEELELVPLARRVVSHDGWFAIGAAFLKQQPAAGAGPVTLK